MTINTTPNCPKCGVALSLFDNELPCGTVWYCDQHEAETGCESIFLTLPDIDAILRDGDVWDAIVVEHMENL